MPARPDARKVWAKRCEDGHVPSLRAETSEDGSTGVLYLYDPIDEWFGVTASDLVQAIAGLGDVKAIDLHINSPGGDVFDAVAFLNTLRAHPATVHAIVDGLAASAASFIAAGSDRLTMGPNSMMMIHDAWGIAIGDAAAMEAMRDLLDKTSDNIAGIYAGKAGGEVADWRAIMREEVWYTDEEALAAGLADEVAAGEDAGDGADVAALHDLSIFAHAGRKHAPAPPGREFVAASLSPARTEPRGNSQGETMPTPPAAPAAPDAPPAPAASAPAGIVGGTPPPASAGETIGSLADLYNALALRHQGKATADIRAALADLTYTAIGGDVNQPQWVGELWDGVRYERKIVPLVGHKDLTGMKVNGWRWTTKPEVDDYAGDKTDVPSNAAETEPVSIDAEILAGAHDHDRRFRDFGDDAYFQSYYEAMTESYAEKSDARLLADMLTAATDIADPGGLGFFRALGAGVTALGAATNSAGTFAVVNPTTALDQLLGVTEFDVPAFLKLLGIDMDRIVIHTGMTAGHVLVGAKAAVDFYELPGSPIRVEAVDLTKGGVDTGVFGYTATLIHKATGLQDVVIDVTP